MELIADWLARLANEHRPQRLRRLVYLTYFEGNKAAPPKFKEGGKPFLLITLERYAVKKRGLLRSMQNFKDITHSYLKSQQKIQIIG